MSNQVMTMLCHGNDKFKRVEEGSLIDFAESLVISNNAESKQKGSQSLPKLKSLGTCSFM